MSKRKIAWRKRIEFGIEGTMASRDVLDGPVLFRTHTIAGVDVERWCRRVSRLSKQRVDFAGSAGFYEVSIAAVDDVELAQRLLWQTIGLHDAAFRRAWAELFGGRRMEHCEDELAEVHRRNQTLTQRNGATGGTSP